MSAERTDGRAQLTDTPQSWPVAATLDLHRDDWVVALRADQITRPGGDEGQFRRLVLEHPGAVVVLAVDDRGRVLCLSQYRHPAQHRFVELPAGLLDGDDESPQTVAARELREEAGLEATEWTQLASAYSSPGISEELIHYFVARGLREVGRGDFELRNEEADMTTFWVQFEELHAACLDGRLTDAPMLVAVLMARARALA